MKAKIILSAMVSILWMLLTCFICVAFELNGALPVSIFSGLLFFPALLAVLVWYEKHQNKKYAQIEKSISSPILYKANGNFQLPGGRVKNGNIYICEVGIVCVCMDEKPYSVDVISKENIDRCLILNLHFQVFTKDGRAFMLTTAAAPEMLKILKEKQWIEL